MTLNGYEKHLRTLPVIEDQSNLKQNTFGEEQELVNFFWINGINYYLEYINHPQLSKLKDIKAAVLDGNIWKIRNLVEDEINRGTVELTHEWMQLLFNKYTGYDHINHRKFLRYIAHCIDDQFIRDISAWSIKWQKRANLNDHFSRGQMMSKMWLLEGMDTLTEHMGTHEIPTVVQYGGWYATVAQFIFQRYNIGKYFSLEVDANCHEVAQNFNYREFRNEWQFKSLTMDVSNVPWNGNMFNAPASTMRKKVVQLQIKPDLIINTSCEHMDEKWFNDIPEGMPVILQTNDYFSNEQHVNCVESVEDALDKYQFSNVLYSGELDTGLYKRFMIAGIR